MAAPTSFDSQEAGCDVGTKRIMWVKVNPDYEILFRLMNGLQSDAGRRYCIKEYSAEVDIVGIGKELGQMAIEVNIAFPMSHNLIFGQEFGLLLLTGHCEPRKGVAIS